MQRRFRLIYLGLLLAGCGDGARDGSPAQATAEVSGAELFANYCSACHGREGEGDGPVAAVMQVRVPNLRTLQMRNGGTFPTDAVTAYVDGRDIPASHGARAMPIWGDVFQWDETGADSEALARRRIDAIVTFVAQLQYR